MIGPEKHVRFNLLEKRTDRCGFARSEKFENTTGSCDKMLIDRVRSGLMGKYLALVKVDRSRCARSVRPDLKQNHLSPTVIPLSQ